MKTHKHLYPQIIAFDNLCDCSPVGKRVVKMSYGTVCQASRNHKNKGT
jgi:hypothetical protein